MDGWVNKLYLGDNLQILREHVPGESVDLIYLDPPFNSSATYNVLFKEQSGEASQAQITAFEDTWHWGTESEWVYSEVVREGPRDLANLLQALRAFLGQNDMMAYLTMMALRLVELHRVLRPTGSLYLHCDPTASHYLKMLLDSIFGPDHFRSEVIWRRSSAHSDTKQGLKNYGHIHDIILFYTKGDKWTWNPQFTPYDQAYVGRDYGLVEEGTGRRFRRGDLTAAKPGGDTEYEWRVKKRAGVRERWIADLDNEYLDPKPGWEYKGVRPYQGRYWAYSKDNMREFAREGRLRHTFEGMPEYKRYLDEMPGVPLQDIWTDINPIVAGTAERLGYPTQKPEALLERIIQVSSNEGDIVLDPFCGCGTAVAVAERLNRRWIGIDITHLAITLMKHRLHNAFGDDLSPYEVQGAPTTVEDARALLDEKDGRHRFEWWALGLIDARPAHDKKKGADTGIDGYINFFDDASGKAKTIIVQVKSGKVTASQVRDLKGVMEREKAPIGAFLTLEAPTRPMIQEAAAAGFYEPPSLPGKRYPRIQILTIQELLDGKKLLYPELGAATFQRAQRRTKDPSPTQGSFRL